MSQAEVLRKIGPALAVLLEAHNYAQALERDLWDFAVELDYLRNSGVTDSDLRCLICIGGAEHASEVTRPGSRKRVFRRTQNLRLTDRTCFVLTKLGKALARKAGLKAADWNKPRVLRRTNNVGGTHNGTRVVPHWDRHRRELRLGELVVKEFKVPAHNQETVLAAFDEEGWPPRIDDPLPPLCDIDPKRRLHDTINKLNRRQKQALLRFRGDGTGRGISWELRSSLPPNFIVDDSAGDQNAPESR